MNKSEIAEIKTKGDFSICGLIVMDIEGKTGRNFKARTLLDSGAGTNFISEEILPEIKCEKIETECLTVSGINTTQSKKHDLVKININNQNCPIKQIKCYVLPKLIEYEIKKNQLKQLMDECKDVEELQNPLEQKVDHKGGVSIVLSPGAIRDISWGPPIWYGNYTIDRTYFGSAISGRLSGEDIKNTITGITLVKNLETNDILILNDNYDKEEQMKRLQLLQELEFLSNKEMLGVKKYELHKNDEICLEEFKKQVEYDKQKKEYIVALPWNNKKMSLPTNINVAYKRMRQLQTKFIRNPTFGKAYQKHIESLEKANYIEEVNEKTTLGNIVHYLPHSGVVKEDSVTTSLRIVMDGSSKRNASEYSLNDTLYTGPKLITELTKCLIRMRCGKFAATSDVEKAFLKLIIRIQDRDALRFFFQMIFSIHKAP